MALLPDEPGRSLVGSQAAKEREALTKVADIAVEAAHDILREQLVARHGVPLSADGRYRRDGTPPALMSRISWTDSVAGTWREL
mgnify:CR=1 FL=1